jgi:hypothetical protein
MRKKLNERQAWLEIAAAWDEVTTDDEGTACALLRGTEYHYGICHCIDDLLGHQAISFEVLESMAGKLPERTWFHRRFCWPRTLRGARQRAAFCRKQAALLARKKAGRK